MKGKKLVLMLVAIIVALSAAVMVACPDEPERVPGPETGTYYYEVGGKEYTLMLMDVDQFVEVNGGEGIRTGTYVLNGSELTLTYPVSSKEEVAETKVGRYDGKANIAIAFYGGGANASVVEYEDYEYARDLRPIREVDLLEEYLRRSLNSSGGLNQNAFLKVVTIVTGVKPFKFVYTNANKLGSAPSLENMISYANGD